MEAHVPALPRLKHFSHKVALVGMYFTFSLWLLAPFRWCFSVWVLYILDMVVYESQ